MMRMKRIDHCTSLIIANGLNHVYYIIEMLWMIVKAISCQKWFFRGSKSNIENFRSDHDFFRVF